MCGWCVWTVCVCALDGLSGHVDINRWEFMDVPAR